MARTVFERRAPRRIADWIDSLIADRLNARAARLQAERGRPMLTFANDRIGIAIAIAGRYERDELDTLFAFLAPLAEEMKRGVALDIGANIGNHTLAFAPRFRAVHAFEPHPLTVKLLDANVAGLPGVTVHPFALGAAHETLAMRDTAANMGEARIEAGGDIAIEVRPLDELGLDDLVFIKMDAEGHEPQILAGATRTVERCQPIIAYEQLAHELAGGGPTATALLSGMGYRFCWIEAGSTATSTLSRRLASLAELNGGRRHRIVSGTVPPRTLSMILAVPPRFVEALGLD